MIRLLAAVFGFLLIGTTAEARIVESFRVGGWNGDAFVNDTTNRFNSCVAIASYRSGISMSVEVDSTYSWWIGFSARGWTMTPGEKIALQYRIDRGAWQQGVAEAISAELARMAMPPDGYIIRRFRRGRVLYVADGVHNYQFRLTGTSRLLARLARCVKQNVARYGAGPGLARAEASPAPTPAPEPAPEPAAKAPPPAADTAQLQIEATQSLFNLMSKAGVTNLKLIAEADRDEDFKGLHAVAGNDNRTMVAQVFPDGSYDSETDIMAQLIFDAARKCEGDFQSGFSAYVIDGDEIFAGRSSCAAGDYEAVERYAIAARGAGGVTVFGVAETSVGEGAGEPSGPSSQLTDDAFHRAVIATGQ